MKRIHYLIIWISILSILLAACDPQLGPGAYLVGANLSGKDLTGMDLSKAILRHANLSGANLSGANLQEAHLAQANLTEANLSKANLQGADLDGANLTGANLKGAILDRAVLSDVKGLSTDMLRDAASLTGAYLNSMEEIQEAVAQVCNGVGVPEATAYQQAPGIHPVVIITQNELLSAPETWQPFSIQATELVACVGRGQSVLLETCEYTVVNIFKPDGTRVAPDPNDSDSSKYTVERYRVEVPIRLVDAQTGNTIAEVALAGTLPQSCGGFDVTKHLTSNETRFGEAPSASDIRNWLEPYVMGTKPAIDLIGHSEEITSASFSPDGKRIITSSKDKTARLWDSQGNLIAVLDDLSFGGVMNSARFSPDGQHIVTVTYNTSYNPNADFDAPAAFPSDLLKTSHLIGVWDIDGNFLTLLGGKVPQLAADNFSPDGTRIVLQDNNSIARVWDTDGNPLVTLKGHTDAVISVGYSPTGDRIATASRDGTARLWDTDGNPLVTLKGHTDAVISVGYSPTGDRIATASRDGTARLWDTKGNLVAVLRNPSDEIGSVYFSPDGVHVMTVSRMGDTHLWDAEGNLVAELKGESSIRLYTSIGFSPDGDRFAASCGKAAKVYDMEGNVLARLAVPFSKGFVKSANFSPDGAYILTRMDEEKAAWLWNAEGQLLAEIKGHTADVTTAVFSPDGTLILTASKDGTARIYDLKSLLAAESVNP